MPLATRKRALELGAGFIEADLDDMRSQAIRNGREAGEHNRARSVTHSHEHDLMKVAEWASAAATLRAMAENE